MVRKSLDRTSAIEYTSTHTKVELDRTLSAGTAEKHNKENTRYKNPCCHVSRFPEGVAD